MSPDPNFLDGLHGTVYTIQGGLSVLLWIVWKKLEKCEARHNAIDDQMRKRLTRPRTKRPQKRK